MTTAASESEETGDPGLPDGEPCLDDEMCAGGWCWADDLSVDLTCQSTCIEPGGPIMHLCDGDDDCCEGWCETAEPWGVGICQF